MTGKTALLFGCITRNENWCGKPLHNTAVLAQNGKIVFQQHKVLLPTYDVFDELSDFDPARAVQIVAIAGKRAAISIGEDLWFNDEVLATKIGSASAVD